MSETDGSTAPRRLTDLLPDDGTVVCRSSTRSSRRPQIHAVDVAESGPHVATYCGYVFRTRDPVTWRGELDEVNCPNCRSRLRRPDPYEPNPQCIAIARSSMQRCRLPASFDGEVCPSHALRMGRIPCGHGECDEPAVSATTYGGSGLCADHDREHRERREREEQQFQQERQIRRQQRRSVPSDPPQQHAANGDGGGAAIRELDRSRRIGWARAYEAERLLDRAAALLVDGHDPLDVAEWMTTKHDAVDLPEPSADAAALIAAMREQGGRR